MSRSSRLLISSIISSAVFSPKKDAKWTYPIWFSSISQEVRGISIVSRTIVTSRVLVVSFSFRSIPRTTVVPFFPFISETAYSRAISCVDLPSICLILSRGINPARSPGVSLIGATIVSSPSRIPTTIPIPSKAPFISSIKVRNSDSSMCLASGSSKALIMSSMLCSFLYASSNTFSSASYR